MKALRIMGAIIAPLAIGCAMVDYFVMSNVYDGTGNAVWMVAVFLGLAGLFGVFSFFAFTFNNKALYCLSFILGLGAIGITIVKILDIVNSFDANWSCIVASVVLVAFGTLFAFIGMVKKPKGGTGKAIKGATEQQTQTGIIHPEDVYNPNIDIPANNNEQQNYVAGGQTVSGNTISERERILKLKEELNGLDFKNIALADENGTLDATEQADNTMTEDTFENTADLKSAIKREEDELALEIAALNHAKTQAQSTPQQAVPPVQAVSKPALQANAADDVKTTELDPYKATIIPRRRRGQLDVGKFEQPIGNTPEKIGANSVPRQHNRGEVKIDEYKDKVFLGDSDRIWAAMQKQDRSLLLKQQQAAKKAEKPKTVEIKAKTIEAIEPTITPNNNTYSGTEEIPTIDWDDD
jgi:hypothetical protein